MSVRDPGLGLEAILDEDALTRRLAQECFTTPLVVEAGAGTGKTSILVARIVAWCLGEGWIQAEEDGSDAEEVAGRAAEGVVAITFTEAAAAEMATRVGEALGEIASGSTPCGVSREALPEPECAIARAEALLSQLHRLRSSTIHSFCRSILSRYPVEAGLSPAFKVDADGSMVAKVAHDAVEHALRRADGAEVWPAWRVLAREGVTPQRVATALVRLIGDGVHSADLASEPYSEAILEAFTESLRDAVSAFSSLEQGRFGGLASRTVARRVGNAVVELETGVRGLLDTLVEPSFATVQALAQAVDESVVKKLGEWAGGTLGGPEAKAIPAAEHDELMVLAGRLQREILAVAEARPTELAAAREVLGDLLEEAWDTLRRQGIVTFNDLLRCARDVLASSKELRDDVRRGITQLLVDEFQDTDPVQCDMVAMLALGGGDGPTAPGLFIVGDPKQSIYGWRSADLEAYHDFVDRVVAGRGRKLRLSMNFRSVPAVLDEVERALAPVMIAEKGLQPPFEKLVPCAARANSSGFIEGGRAAVEYWVSWPPSQAGEGLDPCTGKEARSLEFEAEAVAADIVSLHRDHDVVWSDVGILLRRTSHLDVVLHALRRAGVPYEVTKDREYYRQREVVEAAALVRAIIDPGDQMALLTVLRSEVVGVPDAALPILWRRGLPSLLLGLDRPETEVLHEIACLVSEAAADVPAGALGVNRLPRWPSALVAAVESLAVLRHSLAHDAPEIFVERLRSLWLAEVSAAARYLGGHRVARLDGFFRLVEKALVDGDGGLAQVARALKQAVVREQEAQQVMRPAQDSDAVQIMTIHGAKGLDFGHVYVLQGFSGRQSGGGRQKAEAVVHTCENGLEYRLFGWPTPRFTEMEDRDRLRENAELVRLLYVTLTRAKDRLVFAGSWPESRLHIPGKRAACLGDLVGGRWDHGAIDAQAEAGDARRLEEGTQTAWVLPGLIRDEDAEPWREGDSGSSVPNLAVCTEQWRRLADDRGRAHERMQRPLTGGASVAAHQELEELAAEREVLRQAAGTPSRVAVVVGSEVHRLFEGVDLDGHVEKQLESKSADVLERMQRELDNGDAEVAAERVRALIDTITTGRCLARLQQIGSQNILARELPMILGPKPDQGPVGAIVGIADLVYRDPESGAVVVADYKTDHVAEGPEMERRAEGYRFQLEMYADGIQEAFQLRQRPRMELWFLEVDVIVLL